MQGLNIRHFDFSKEGRDQVLKTKKGQDWPVVYLIHNDKELYIGESSNMSNRFEQHLNNKERKGLKGIEIIFDDEFNKSAILDIEQSLIQLCTADEKYKLQNQNGGQSKKHNYYQREKYLNKLDIIWKELSLKGMTNKSLLDVRNSDLFKYSPYNTLTSEQDNVCNAVIKDIISKFKEDKNGTSIIKGVAGTGKTIVLINMIYKLINATKYDISFSEEDEVLSEYYQIVHDIKQLVATLGHELRIGYVVPMKSIRSTLSKVFGKTKNGLTSKMVIGPLDVIKNEYDILFVDEAHRLVQRKNISNMGSNDAAMKKSGLDPLVDTTVDLIVKNAKYKVFVYDSNQTVKGSDVTEDQFRKAISKESVQEHTLKSQMRCKGGESYVSYLDRILNCSQELFQEIEEYDFQIFDDVDKMINKIKELDRKFGLCRNAAGYSWKWKSKKKKYEDVMKNNLQDIEIQGHKYVWNATNSEFILSKNAINEIGCIHTMQGYDLNYVGVIFGREIDYNPKTNKIEINLKNFYDTNVKKATDYETVKQYIINSYKVIMERGIKGCYVFACNENMQQYLKRFIKENK